jgi:Domain of unknown function (DUF6484)
MKSEQFVVGLEFATLEGAFGAGQEDTTKECPADADLPAACGSPGTCNPSAIQIGVLLGFDTRGEPLVASRPGDTFSARSLVPLGLAELGREVVLAFDGGDPGKPVIMGLVQPRPGQASPASTNSVSATSPIEVKLDGERLIITAHQQIVLRCGEASITLTRAGKVLIRGAHLVSRSSGMNRIQGGVVHIN